MNYWPSGIANLSECFLPYIAYAKAYLPSAYRIADEYIHENYPENASPAPHGNGWTIGTGATLYFITTVGGHSGPGTGGFTSLLFWDYYEFTGDKEYLATIGYPILRDMSLFLSKVVVQMDGKLLVRLSASPEQQGPDGRYYETVGCAFDQQMIYENHKRTLEAAEILGITDDPLLPVLHKQLPLLDPVQIGLDRQVKEFREEGHYGEIGEYEHRHISHLVGLYPGTLINKNTPEWARGCENFPDKALRPLYRMGGGAPALRVGTYRRREPRLCAVSFHVGTQYAAEPVGHASAVPNRWEFRCCGGNFRDAPAKSGRFSGFPCGAAGRMGERLL